MMTNLLLEENDILLLENVSLPVATYAKFQPQSSDFLDITNPKAVWDICKNTKQTQCTCEQQIAKFSL